MNLTWQQFLQQQGAVLDGGVVQHFGDLPSELFAAQNNTVLCDLSQFGVLRVSGEEAQSFLQNLLSNDIREVASNRAQLSSLNDPKGRMLATMLIWRDDSGYLLQLPRPLCETIRKKLSMYVLRAKVKIADASDEIVALGLSGPAAQELLSRLFGELPQTPNSLTATGEACVIRLGDTRFQIATAAQYAPTIWQTLAQHAHPAGSACWDWLNIRAGVPVILPPTQEQFVPQMANFEVIGGVNFKKGCYPGQEIVARMQYLGKLKRRMYLAHIDGGAVPQPGDALFSGDMEGQSSGMVANAATAPGGGYDVLAVVQIASHDAHQVHLGSPAGARLQFQPPPYPLP
ncbi:folate-binding protein [Ferrigenium kumadai]|uniref:Folate-binding protein n=1 Tax=Ferrigenium kumadai TaxID=1682490 RepID=A0AAN1T070_9PROT|nr:folate-binding protein YgfZ [Ferrigenium kumadai]BBI99871.1 folate-binding protein [Ferrigenium kumadai]